MPACVVKTSPMMGAVDPPPPPGPREGGGGEPRPAGGQGGVGVRYAPADRIADAELRPALRRFEDGEHERHHPAVDVCAGAVFQVHAWGDAVLAGGEDRAEVLVHRLLFAVIAELVEGVGV